MRILFITTSHNGLSQRAWAALTALGHQIEIHVATTGNAMEQAVEDFSPALIIAPFLKQAIPESIWRNHTCFIVHPGIKGDRGPSSLDWAIMNQATEWGVTILEAAEEMDAGDIWSTNNFPMRPVSKSNLYRHEVTQAAVKGIVDAVQKFESSTYIPEKLNYDNPTTKGQWNDPIKRKDRAIDWSMPSAEIVKRVKAADSNPGVLENNIFPMPCFMFGAHLEDTLKGSPGEIIAQRDGAICIGSGDGAVWLSHLKAKGIGHFKLPAATVLDGYLDQVPHDHRKVVGEDFSTHTYREIWYQEEGRVGYLHFDFYNGAMSTDQCQRLRQALFEAKERPTDMIVLMGGHDIWSNGIHLNVIEHAANPAQESWNNIVAIDDLVGDILATHSHYVISAMQGNAGAGGVMLALAADQVMARAGLVLNPHYKKMGLYGSEYWTYTLPKRVGEEMAQKLTNECLPITSDAAVEIGMVDEAFGQNVAAFRQMLKAKVAQLADTIDFEEFRKNKRKRLFEEMAASPPIEYRNRELSQMWKNFYAAGSEYHALRHYFVHKIACAQQPVQYQINNFKLAASQ